MLNEDDGKTVKKPIPLPRKSLQKQSKPAEIKETRNEVEHIPKKPEERNFIRGDWKSASESFVFEKSRQMKNEVQKLGRSMRSMTSRRSLCSKSSDECNDKEHTRSESMPDDSIFCSISFDSPLAESAKSTESSNYSGDLNFYEGDVSPPPYPPPDLPDESIYDTMRSCGLSEIYSSKSASSDSASSMCTDHSMCQTVPNFADHGKSDFFKEETSSVFSDEANENRYEEIDSNLFDSDCSKYLTSIPESHSSNLHSTDDSTSCCSEPKENHYANLKYIVHLFDPLEKNEGKHSDDKIDLKSCNSISSLNSDSSSHLGFINNDMKKLKPKDYEIFPVPTEFQIPPNLKEGHYGKINKLKNPKDELVDTVPIFDLMSKPPPIPPRRFDSYACASEENSNEQTEDPKDIEEMKKKCDSTDGKSKGSDIIQWSSIKRVAKKLADNIENRASYMSFSGKKALKQANEYSSWENLFDKIKSSSQNENYCYLTTYTTYSGVVYRPGGIERWGVLSQRKLTLFANKDSPDVKETVPVDSVLSIQITHNKISPEAVSIHCFELSTTSRSHPLLFGVPSVSERHIWMRKLLESIGPPFHGKISMDYTKAGWCYAKESVSSSWTRSSILLHQRALYLASETDLITADIRKARHISLQTEGFPCDMVTEKGPLMVIDLQDKTLYLQMDYQRETKAWELMLTAAALRNGPTLCEQQLTKDNVPAIVDKCLNFVHTHGCFSEGIYRRNGSNRTVRQLLSSFRYNAWAVQLSKQDCNEFDVCSVLKRYFRDLPEPLLVTEIHDELGSISEITDLDEKIAGYRAALKKLPNINYLTARRLMGHLYFVNKQKDKNLMSSENLAAIWGPTILQVQDQISFDSNSFKVEAVVINDLICYYPEIFEVEKAEVEREMKILQMLEKYYNNSNTVNKKPSGELKIWVYLYSPNDIDNCINITINPQKTAEEVCKELSAKTLDPCHLLCLEEVICNGSLSRPIHHSEKLLDTVLRWSYWDEADRKDNCLVLAKNDLFRQVGQNAKSLTPVCEELKFADAKSKSFRMCQFEFSQAKLVCYRDKACSQKIAEWKIEDIIWYFGYEAKRPTYSRWSITFIEKDSVGPRTKERPFFGNTICGSSEEQKFKLISAMLMSQYANDLLPSPNFME